MSARIGLFAFALAVPFALAVGQQTSTSTDRDRTTMEQEPADKALPEGKTTRAVAGYLYYPKPTARQRNAAYEISWYGNDRHVHLTIPAVK
jgi:hypothetical protein